MSKGGAVAPESRRLGDIYLRLPNFTGDLLIPDVVATLHPEENTLELDGWGVAYDIRYSTTDELMADWTRLLAAHEQTT